MNIRIASILLAITLLSPSAALAEKIQIWIVGTSETSGWTVSATGRQVEDIVDTRIDAKQVSKTQAANGLAAGILFEIEKPSFGFYLEIRNFLKLPEPQVAFGELQFADGSAVRTPANIVVDAPIIYSDWNRDHRNAVRYVIVLK